MYLSGGANKPTIERLDSSWTAVADGQRKLLQTIAELDPDSELWRRDGHRGPGCGVRSFPKAHHIDWWGRGGPTDLDNLTLCCHFHHKLVHEGGWDVRLNHDGTTTWIRSDGRELDPGRAPPALIAG
jgi:hypothetical protein